MEILLILFVVVWILSIPRWPYSREWGYGPFGLLSTMLTLILILWLFGAIKVIAR